MMIGCGHTVKTIKGRRYLYVWTYETMNGRSKQVYRYMGPAGRAATKEKARKVILAYHETARQQLARERHRMEAELVEA
jgi:hypothetical protein